jgi:hypothetical protein
VGESCTFLLAPPCDDPAHAEHANGRRSYGDLQRFDGSRVGMPGKRLCPGCWRRRYHWANRLSLCEKKRIRRRHAQEYDLVRSPYEGVKPEKRAVPVAGMPPVLNRAGRYDELTDRAAAALLLALYGDLFPPWDDDGDVDGFEDED